MGLDGIHNVPDFHYNPRIKESKGNPKDREEEAEQGKQKKKKDQKKEALFESLADSLSQYGDEPFQFSG